MLNAYCSKVLERELRSPEYDGMSADQGWAWLMLPRTTIEQVDTHLKLTPMVATITIGPIKANALAEAIKTKIPAIADILMSVGVDLSDNATGAFLDSLVDNSTVMAEDINALKALGKKTETTTFRRRFEERFDPMRWPHVDINGEQGNQTNQAIHGFPNDLTREEFDVSWAAAGRT